MRLLTETPTHHPKNPVNSENSNHPTQGTRCNPVHGSSRPRRPCCAENRKSGAMSSGSVSLTHFYLETARMKRDRSSKQTTPLGLLASRLSPPRRALLPRHGTGGPATQ
jgi:hypothetical protein